VTVTDGNDESRSKTFLLTVNSVNDPPTISDIVDRSTSEDTPTESITLSVGDTETAAAALVVTASSSNAALVPSGNIVFAGSGTGRTLIITPAANQYGVATVTVTVADGEGASTSDTFVLTVNAVNDPPVVSALRDAPDPVRVGSDLTLTATGVADPADPQGSIAGVAFYREANGDPGLQLGEDGDTLVGLDSDPAGGWSTTASTASLTPDTYAYYALATDNEGAHSGDGTAAASTTNTLLYNCDLDVDGNGQADALTDGILIVRYLFDPAATWDCADALGTGATRTTHPAIKSYLDSGLTTVLDVDGNGQADALTDGILILRYLFNPLGEWKHIDALGADATRTNLTDIKAFLDRCNPPLAPGMSAGETPALASPLEKAAAAIAATNAADSAALDSVACARPQQILAEDACGGTASAADDNGLASPVASAPRAGGVAQRGDAAVFRNQAQDLALQQWNLADSRDSRPDWLPGIGWLNRQRPGFAPADDLFGDDDSDWFVP
jgi:hypothetical protein